MSGNIVLDTNVIIYLSKKTLNPEKIFKKDAIYAITVISKMKLLGHPFKNSLEEQYILEIINSLIVVPLTDAVVNFTISIRKQHKIKLPDAIIYATAATLNAKLITNNINDFIKTKGRVELVDPFS